MRLALLFLVLAAGIEAPSAGSTLVPGSRLVLLGDATDERARVVRAAVEFWDEVFKELRLESPFGRVSVDDRSPRRPLETYARQLSQQAGRNRSGPGPPPPSALLEHEEEVVVLLSRQKLMPFAWPLAQTQSRFFLALPRGADLEIAKHELGHILGLRHGGPTGLMCMPCEGGGERTPSGAERRELERLYRP